MKMVEITQFQKELMNPKLNGLKILKIMGIG